MQDIQFTRRSSSQHHDAASAAAAVVAPPPVPPANGEARRLEMCPSLYLAAYKGRVEEVMALLAQPRHGTAQGDRRVSGIVHHGQCDLLEVSAERNTLLHVAAEQGHGELIQELYHRFIKDKTFLSRRNSSLDTPLHCAARAGRVNTVKTLLNLPWNSGVEDFLGCQNVAGDTALHLAARHGHGAAVEALVAARASASELNKAGVSPLYLAVMSRSVAAVRAIITTCEDASSVGPSSQNALHAAVFQSSEMVHLLLQWKPELAIQVDCNGSTPLHFAASNNNRSVVSAILRVAPPSTAYMKDMEGLSALHVAARLGHDDVVKELIRFYPDTAELRDGHGETFLHAAARERRSSVVSLAIKNPMLGGLLNAQDAGGNTPLHLAVVADAPDIVEALLRKGNVQTDVLNDDGHTPLDLASKSNSLFNMVSFVVTLVTFGAQARPQRNDHLKPSSGHDMASGIEKTSDSLAVVAVLIGAAAFAAGFNMPGGYGDDGTANLKGSVAFEYFVVLDTFAVAASVVAVVLLVYGKASHSAVSWKSFMVALQCIWASLVGLILAFYSASHAVVVTTSSSRTVLIIMFLVIYVCLNALILWIEKWVDPAATTYRAVWRFVWRGRHAHAIKRRYPFVGASVYSLLIFSVINITTFVGLAVVYYFDDIQLARCSSQHHGSPASAASASAAAVPANGDSRRLELEMCPALYLAAYKGRVEEVMALLLQPRLGDVAVAQGDHQLHGIVHHGQCDLLEVSVERNTILHVAAEHGHGELIQELYHRFITDKSILSRRNTAMDTPLHCAARAGHPNAVEVLLNLSRDCAEIILNRKNEAGDTALHLAARHGHGAAVAALVTARASASELNKAGVSPLYLAVMSGSVPALRAIINTSSGDVSSVGPSSQNALHAAIFHSSSEMANLLLKWKPCLAGQVDCNGSTPLHFAASDGDRSMISAILRAAPPGTVYMKDSEGLSALHVAARMGHAGVVEGIIGAFPNAAELRDGHGETFLHAAAKEKRSSVVALAIKSPMLRSLLNSQNRDGNTPLHLAVAAGAPRVVEALLQEGQVRADVLNEEGHTPLDLASKSTSLFTMVSLVVTLVAFRAQPRPQRQDHLKPWSSRDKEHWIEKTSDNLAVVAVLIATVAFAAGFNMPGGYHEKKGIANLQGSGSFKWFMFLDTVAMAASVVAVILLIYGKASSSADSWKSFVAALHCMWGSLVSLIGAFYLALTAVTEVKAVFFGFLAVNAGLWVLVFSIGSWVELAASSRTIWRFWWWSRSGGRQRAHAIKRQYPYASHSVVNLLLFKLINFLAFLGMATTICFKLQSLLRKCTTTKIPCRDTFLEAFCKLKAFSALLRM
uniref:PGG domain-containing protein n=1 Tax=Oryza punctata TaxID=4537 RepID=A0A0E0MD72_ORYPU